MKRKVQCTRCGIERFAYPSEQQPVYFETTRCENTEKRSDHPAKSSRTAPSETHLEEGPNMSKHTPEAVTGTSHTFSGMPEEVKESPVVDIDGAIYGADQTFRRASVFVLGEEGEHPEYQFGLYDVFDDHGRQIHAQRLVIEEDGHKEVWVDTAPEVLRHIADWLFREASALIPAAQEADQ